MLRQALRRLPGPSPGNSIVSRRAYAAAATSAQKRALNAQQLKGEAKANPAAATAAATKTSSTTAQAAADAGGSSAPVAVEGGNAGGGTGLAMALVVATGGAGAAYYNGLLDEYLGDFPASFSKEFKQKEKPKTEAVVAKTSATATAKTNETPAPSTKGDENLARAAKEEVDLSNKEIEEFQDMIADVIGEAAEEVAGVHDAVEAIAKEEEKMAADNAAVTAAAAVAAAAASKAAAKKSKSKKSTAVVEEAAATTTPVIGMGSAIATSTLDESKIMAEIEELKKKLNERTDQALSEAHTELARISSIDVMGLDLDSMTTSQLKVRLVQMARDLEERTKWEAVRLQEFLIMKEKEVEDRYVLLIKRLRLEAEQLQEEKLVEQKKALVAEAEEAIQEQQTRLDAFLKNSMEIQEKAHAEDKLAFEQKTKEAMDARYEELLGQELTRIKEEFATRMNQRVRQMEELTKKLSALETSFQASQDFRVGSLEAHKITAAAIALMEKLESGDPAGAAVRALEAVASENAVVETAVQSLPESVSRSGVKTLQELQASYEEAVYPQCRRAANVPEGQDGLEGQLLATVFSSLKPPPGPGEAAPESEKDDPEYVLARIKRYVQLGELEDAVLETKKLEGQVAFTAKDWLGQATDRVAVEKALKVIRMECALANETLTQDAVAA